MAESIQGGATKDAAGVWYSADGKPLSKEAQVQAERLHADLAQQRKAADEALVRAEAARNPITQALLLQQAQAKIVK